ncbi:hypothetical protein GOV08_05410 [Candidatus Woesearchaeota archaeon]|nr:hypothetical protein [Candidatus Woesearchaeota archaeon]
MWAGGTIVVLTIIVSLLSGLLTEAIFCGNFEDTIGDEQTRLIPGSTTTEEQIKWAENLETKIQCSNVDTKIFLSYITIIIGVSLVLAGYITRKS